MGSTTATAEAEAEAAIASTEKAMREAGVPTEEVLYEDYFGFQLDAQVFLPDGKQYVVHRQLNEGQRRKYLNSINRDVVIQRATGDARMRMSPGDERHSLLTEAIIDWSIMRRTDPKDPTSAFVPVPFGKRELDEFLEKAPPKVIDVIEKEVRKANPWLLQELSVEEIDKEIASLQELREAKLKEEAGKLS